MKTLIRILLSAALLATAFTARADRVFNQAELDALLAPIALYPDAVLSNVLVAAGLPDEVHEAAAWSRANPQLRGDDALRLVENTPWQPSVRALTAFPEVLTRMDESPVWMRDLAEAYRVHGPYVMDTVQSLRRRAQATGNLQSDGYQQVYDDGGAIAIAPAYPQYVYVRYYDPFVVYGPWWWPAYRPVFWRPWPVYRTYVSVGFVAARPDWHRRVVVVNRPVVARQQVVVNRPTVVNRPIARAQFNGGPSPAAREQQRYSRERQQERVQAQRISPAAQAQRFSPAAQAQRMPPAQGFHGAPPRQPQGHSSPSGNRGERRGDRRG